LYLSLIGALNKNVNCCRFSSAPVVPKLGTTEIKSYSKSLNNAPTYSPYDRY